jgi:hypothetical protein
MSEVESQVTNEMAKAITAEIVIGKGKFKGASSKGPLIGNVNGRR